MALAAWRWETVVTWAQGSGVNHAEKSPDSPPALALGEAYAEHCPGRPAHRQDFGFLTSVDTGDLPLNPEVTPLQINAFPFGARQSSPTESSGWFWVHQYAALFCFPQEGLGVL